MGTRSTIALEEGGQIRSVYCHWDGYPEHHAPILLGHYDHEKTRRLIDLGDLSVLGEELGEKHPFAGLHPGVCTFYGRDRGETDTDAATHESWESLALMLDRRDSEYLYLFSDGRWYFAPARFGGGGGRGGVARSELRPLDQWRVYEENPNAG